MRPSHRHPEQLRPLQFTRHFTRYAEGSVLVAMGDTRVLCTASVHSRVPPFLRGHNQGWITAEYGMLPRATGERMTREAASGHQGGRTLEIQRLIGRALRQAVDLKALGERTITLDCDVLQADGGTRVAAINGAWIALWDALNHLQTLGQLTTNPLKSGVAAVSVGIFAEIPVLDLDYAEDHQASTDMNVVMNDAGQLIEVQATAEGQPFSREMLDQLLVLATQGITQIMIAQRACLIE